MDPITLSFQSAIPLLLHSVSPQLAALHTRRISTSDSYHCKNCGYYLFSGRSVTRFVRQPARSGNSTRTRRSTCLQCGSVTTIPLDQTSTLFQTRKVSNPGNSAPIAVATSSVEPRTTSHIRTDPSTNSSSSAKSTSRPKKKSGLQEMLAQKRAKEERAKKSSNLGQSSLAAFLDSL
ncbi:hypothetical protein GYMLUDRAFT_36911 [Collybiopsis luxurians FD-317 M1]|nr:hypothetical protein GYMLUDRAFT_36911 [Collybiopsis luxurians FD-317 M1]